MTSWGTLICGEYLPDGTMLSIYSLNCDLSGWQKLCEGTKGLRRKVWTLTKILSPKICYFVAKLRFVLIYTLFGNLRAKNVPFWVTNSVSLARIALLHGIYYILSWVDFANIWLRPKTTHLYTINENFHSHFCLRRKAANFCHPAVLWNSRFVVICKCRIIKKC